jgi:hypothetical protein
LPKIGQQTLINALIGRKPCRQAVLDKARLHF